MGRIYYRYIDHQIKNDRKLIANVKYFPVIYDVTNPSYNSGPERRRIWEEIAQNLKSTAKKCEERWNKLIEMYKCKTVSLHDALLEIMDQFMNLQLDPENHAILTYEDRGGEAIGLSADDSEEQIDLEQLICSGFMDNAAVTALPDTDPFSNNNNNKSQTHSTFTDTFFETEDVLELYQDFSHSV